MKCVFLYNPNSGKGGLKKKLPYIERRLRATYDEVKLCVAEGADDIPRMAAEYAEKCDAIIFSGGDGTFHRVLNAVQGKSVQLGYLPSGTVNDIARSLRIPRSLRGALNVVEAGNARLLDCMQLNGSRYAMYIAAAGAFTSATYQTSQRNKRAFGILAYAFRVVKKNLKLEVFPVKIEADGQTLEGNAVLVMLLNGRSVAGFPVNQKGSMTDGTLEAVVIRQVEKPNFFQRIGALFSLASLLAFGCRIHKKDIAYLSGKNLRVTTADSVVWDFDGEEGPRGNLSVAVCPESVRVFVPKTNKRI